MQALAERRGETHIDSPETFDWNRKTSRQLDDRLTSRDALVLVPWGAIEAHGPHLPIGTDSYIARGLATFIADRVDGAIVAPTLPFGYAPRTNFPGTLSTDLETLTRLLSNLTVEIARSGAASLAFIPAHAENMLLLNLLAPNLAQLTDTRVLPFLDLADFMAERNQVLEGHGVEPEEGGWHAGASETSVMLALHPELVDLAAARRGFTRRHFSEELAATLLDGYRHLDPDGIMGDPTKATPAIGRDIIAKIGERFLTNNATYFD